MEGPITDNQSVPMVQQEDGERIAGENAIIDQQNQVLDGESDQHLLQQSVGNVSISNHVPLSVMIAVQGNNNRNDMLNPSMSNIIPQPIRYSNFPTSILQQYPYPNGNTLPYNNEMTNGAGSISLAPVTPNMNVSQNSSVQITGSLPPFSNNDIRLQPMETDTQRLMNPYYLPNYLKHSEDVCLFNCLSSLDADGFQVSQQSAIRLLAEIFNDSERVAISKDDNQLAQVLQFFLQQHQELVVKNVIYVDEFDVNKKQLEFNSLLSLYAQFSSNDLLIDKDGKTVLDPQWIPQNMYTTTRRTETVQQKTIKNARPGKPTVLTADEEAILADFILRLEEKGIRLPREDVGKLVLGILSTLGRPHPFKEDGPHRHWFNGFFKRNPSIMRSRQNSNSIPREQLKDEQINQFLNEIKRLDLNGALHFAAHHLSYSSLDETGYHLNVNQEMVAAAVPAFITTHNPMPPPPPPPMNVEGGEKKYRKTWTSEQLKWAVDEVVNGRATIKDASDRSGIPVATIRNHCRNPQMGARRGPPTVLTATEELALERFLLKLDDCGYKANKEELGKLVMEIVNSDKRPHPFKEDGPHRHWFDGYYRRHKILLARRKTGNSSLSRQEAPPEMMKRFFDELNELKIQNGEIIESRHNKRQKMNTDIIIGVDGSGINYEIPTTIDPASMTQPSSELLTQLPPGTHPVSISPPLATNMSPPEVFTETTGKKGGRPKLRLFSVRPNRQKMRVARIMQYIRSFAVENQENVDDILWSLLMLRVKGSGNSDIYGELEKLYQIWDRYISNTDVSTSADIPPLNPPVPIQPSISSSTNQAPPINVDIVPLPQPMQNTDGDYAMHTLPMDTTILENVNSELITRV